MQDYGRTQELVTAAYNSNGASAKQYGKTMESMQTKLANLKNSWDQFTMSILDSDFAKTIIDGVNGIIAAINKLDELLGSKGGGIAKALLGLGVFKIGGGVAKSFVTALPKLKTEGWESFQQAFAGNAKTRFAGAKSTFIFSTKEKREQRVDDFASSIQYNSSAKQYLEETKALNDKESALAGVNEELTRLQEHEDDQSEQHQQQMRQLKDRRVALEQERDALTTSVQKQKQNVQALQETTVALKRAQAAALVAAGIFAGVSKALNDAGKTDAANVFSSLAVGLTVAATAMGVLTQATQLFNKTLSATKIGIILTAVAAITTAISLLSKRESELEKLQKRIEKNKESVGQLQTKFDDLSSAVDQVQSMEQTFEGLRQKTKEWNAALGESSQLILQLLAENPMLAQFLKYDTEQGRWGIDTEKWDEYQRTQTNLITAGDMGTNSIERKKSETEMDEKIADEGWNSNRTNTLNIVRALYFDTRLHEVKNGDYTHAVVTEDDFYQWLNDNSDYINETLSHMYPSTYGAHDDPANKAIDKYLAMRLSRDERWTHNWEKDVQVFNEAVQGVFEAQATEEPEKKELLIMFGERLDSGLSAILNTLDIDPRTLLTSYYEDDGTIDPDTLPDMIRKAYGDAATMGKYNPDTGIVTINVNGVEYEVSVDAVVATAASYDLAKNGLDTQIVEEYNNAVRQAEYGYAPNDGINGFSGYVFDSDTPSEVKRYVNSLMQTRQDNLEAWMDDLGLAADAKEALNGLPIGEVEKVLQNASLLNNISNNSTMDASQIIALLGQEALRNEDFVNYLLENPAPTAQELIAAGFADAEKAKLLADDISLLGIKKITPALDGLLEQLSDVREPIFGDVKDLASLNSKQYDNLRSLGWIGDTDYIQGSDGNYYYVGKDLQGYQKKLQGRYGKAVEDSNKQEQELFDSGDETRHPLPNSELLSQKYGTDVVRILTDAARLARTSFRPWSSQDVEDYQAAVRAALYQSGLDDSSIDYYTKQITSNRGSPKILAYDIERANKLGIDLDTVAKTAQQYGFVSPNAATGYLANREGYNALMSMDLEDIQTNPFDIIATLMENYGIELDKANEVINNPDFKRIMSEIQTGSKDAYDELLTWMDISKDYYLEQEAFLLLQQENTENIVEAYKDTISVLDLAKKAANDENARLALTQQALESGMTKEEIASYRRNYTGIGNAAFTYQNGTAFGIDAATIRMQANNLRSDEQYKNYSLDDLTRVAEVQLRVEAGYEDLQESGIDSIDSLTAGTQDYNGVLVDTNNALKKIAGITDEAFTFDSSFIIDNLDLIKRAITGDKEAMEQLNDEIEKYGGAQIVGIGNEGAGKGRTLTREEANTQITESGVFGQPEYAQFQTLIENFDSAAQQMLQDADYTAFNLSGILSDVNFDGSKVQTEFVNLLNSMLATGAIAADQLDRALAGTGYEVVSTVTYNSIPIETVGYDSTAFTTYGTPATSQALTSTKVGEIKIPHVKAEVRKKGNGNLTSDYSGTGTSGGKGGGGGGGGGGKSDIWKNPYDKLYNLNEEINEELRKREVLEAKLNRLIDERSSSYTENAKFMEEELASLQKSVQLQQQYANERRKQIDDLANHQFESNGTTKKLGSSGWNVTRYAKYDYDRNVIVIDWEGINKVTNPDTGAAIEEYIGLLEQYSADYEAYESQKEQYLQSYEDLLEAYQDNYLNFETRVRDAIVTDRQNQISELEDYYKAIEDSNSEMIDSLKESVELQRQIRDNTEKEEDITDKELRLAYLQRDTSGGNAAEIKKLQEEIKDDQRDYSDELVDQAIEALSTQNDKLSEQYDKEIEILNEQLEYEKKAGLLWEHVHQLMNEALTLNPETGEYDLNQDSALIGLLRKVDEYRSQSERGQYKTDTQNLEDYRRAMMGDEAYLIDQREQWKSAANQSGSSTIYVADESSPTGYRAVQLTRQNSNYNAGQQVWVDENRNVYDLESAQRLENGEFTATSSGPEVAPKIPYYKLKDKDIHQFAIAAFDTKNSGWKNLSELTSTLANWGVLQESIDAVVSDYNKIKSQTSVANAAKKLGVKNSSGAYQTTVWSGYVKSAAQNTVRANEIIELDMKSLEQYATGGLNTTTGLAWLDGTKTKPELVLNATDTQRLLEIVNNVRQMPDTTDISHNTELNFTFNGVEFSNDYDVDMMAERIQEIIAQNALFRNTNIVTRKR